jgi:hypothetical protein
MSTYRGLAWGCVALFLLLLASVAYGVDDTCPPPSPLPPVSGASPTQKPIVLIVLENQDAKEVFKHPYFRDELPKLGVLFMNSYGVAHPSYPNYLALVGKHIVDEDWTDTQYEALPCSEHHSIVQAIEAKSLRWKSYVEAYPEQDKRPNDPLKCGSVGIKKSDPDAPAKYARRHVPLLSFEYARRYGCSNIVDASQFVMDVRTGNLPDFSFYSPDLCHDGHGNFSADAQGSCDFTPLSDDEVRLQKAATWLQEFLAGFQAAGPDLYNRSSIIITFDESENHLPIPVAKAVDRLFQQPGSKGNKIYTIFIGADIHTGTRADLIDHYDMRATIEKRLGLPSAIPTGRPIPDIWKDEKKAP